MTGADLLAQYSYLGFGFKLAVVCDDANQITQPKPIRYRQPLTGNNGVIMSQNWMRHFELQLLDENGKGIDR